MNNINNDNDNNVNNDNDNNSNNEYNNNNNNDDDDNNGSDNSENDKVSLMLKVWKEHIPFGSIHFEFHYYDLWKPWKKGIAVSCIPVHWMACMSV